MEYSTENIAKELKAAREAKGLSQRALGNLVGMPQSHISKIEKGGVDLRLSSLVEIARALDLELSLVPRKNLAAVRTITRPRVAVINDAEQPAKAAKAFKRLQDTAAKIAKQHFSLSEVAQFQRRLNDLDRLKIPASAIDQIKRIDELLNDFAEEPGNIRALRESLNRIQELRNQLAHSQFDLPQAEKIRPVYSLEEGEDG